MANLQLAVLDSQPVSISVEKSAKKPKKEVDESRRDEWSGEAIDSLLDVYEAKWNHRNRRNLKGGDWEDVALRVSARRGGLRAAKTSFQCKNKVASMKQKYRSEALLKGIHGSTSSRWPFFTRLDAMLRVPGREDEDASGDGATGPGGMQGAVIDLRLQEPIPQVESGDSEKEVTRREQGPFPGRLPHGKIEFPREGAGHNRDSNQEDASNTLPQRKGSGGQESDTFTPRTKAPHTSGVSRKPTKHRRHLNRRDVAASIRSFAGSILKLEEAKMEMFKDSERLRTELEARRVDMELRRTELIMNTQLQIAKLLSGNSTKRKAPKPVNAKAAATPSKVASPLQFARQAHPAAAMQASLSANMTSTMRATPTASMAHPPA